MSRYRIEFKGDYNVDVPITIMEMDRFAFTSEDFKIIKSEAFWMAREITEGYCRATVYRDCKRCFRYTVILEELFYGERQTTQIWSAWPGDNYRTMRKVTFKEDGTWVPYT